MTEKSISVPERFLRELASDLDRSAEHAEEWNGSHVFHEGGGPVRMKFPVPARRMREHVRRLEQIQAEAHLAEVSK